MTNPEPRKHIEGHVGDHSSGTTLGDYNTQVTILSNAIDDKDLGSIGSQGVDIVGAVTNRTYDSVAIVNSLRSIEPRFTSVYTGSA